MARRFLKSARLLTPADFEMVRKTGVSVTTSAMKVRAKPGKNQRLGLITSRRIGRAVSRNRIRRVIREHFRLERERYPAGDCVIIPFSKAEGLSNDELRKELNRALVLAGEKLCRKQR